jgi:hypothetical protein
MYVLGLGSERPGRPEFLVGCGDIHADDLRGGGTALARACTVLRCM